MAFAPNITPEGARRRLVKGYICAPLGAVMIAAAFVVPDGPLWWLFGAGLAVDAFAAFCIFQGKKQW